MMQFSVPLFDQMINQMGQKVTWQRSTECPCTDPSSGQPNPSCPYCQGTGFVYAEQVPSLVALTSQKVAQQWANFGMWQSGDVVVTIGSDQAIYDCGEADRVIFLQSSIPFSQVMTRGRERWPAGMCAAEKATWFDPETNVLLTTTPPEVSPEGSISWDDVQNGPEKGQRYTLSGRRRPVFWVFKDFPQDRAHCGGMTLPRRVVLRLYDLAGK